MPLAIITETHNCSVWREWDCAIHPYKCDNCLALLPPMIDKCSSFSLETLYAQAVVGRWHLLQGRVFPSPLILFEITSQSCPETRLVFEFRPNGIDSQDWPSQRLGKSEGAYIVILMQHKEVRLVSIGVETCWLSGGSEDLGMSIFLSLYKTMLVNLRATTTVW